MLPRRMRVLVAGCLFAALQGAIAAPGGETAESDAVREFAEAYAQIKARYADRLDDRKLVADAIRGMVGGLDPHSAYLEADAYDGLRQETAGSFGGLGMEVSMDHNAVRVLSAFDDSPAAKAGLQAGDLITRLGETSVEGLTLEQAIRQARGAPDSSITLTVLRQGEAQPRLLTLKRAVIQTRSVRFAPVGAAFVHLQVNAFNRQTGDRMLEALARAYDQLGVVKGIVLDLRDNPGGVLGAAVAVSAAFLPEESLVVYTEGAAAESRMTLHTRRNAAPADERARALAAALKSVPLVVLVNGGSASAAEIVAGALQSHKRAAVIGTRTFGKGSVQVVVPLGGGSALKLTTAYYYTPDGRRIQGEGVVPDLVSEQRLADAVAGGDPLLRTRNTCVGPVPAPTTEATAPDKDTTAADDCPLQRAIELLLHQPLLARG